MNIGCFNDKNHRPADGEIADAIGDKMPLWHALVAFVRETFRCEEDFSFLYGKKYGWALRFKHRRKLLAALFPARGGFFALVILGSSAVEKAL